MNGEKVASFRGPRKVNLGAMSTGGSGSGGDGLLEKLEKRVEKLDGEVVVLQKDVAIIKATMATKDDLHKELNAQTGRFITWMFGIFSLFVALNAGISLLLRFVGKP